MTDSAAAADPSVCYRHPDRQSWVLCQRCGRTICPECQILAPVGVQCPECVREAGGSVRWQSTGSPLSSAAKRRSRPRWVQSLLRLLHPDSDAPVLTYGILGISVLLWIFGFFTSNLPLAMLAASPAQPAWQVWRYATSVFSYPSALSFTGLLSFLLSCVFFFLIAPTAERMFGKPRFLLVFFSGAIVGAALSVITGYPYAVGFSGALFGLLAGFFIVQRSMGGVGTQLLIIIALNVMISVLFGGNLAMLFGGLIGGGLAAFILGRFEYRARSKPSTPVALIVAIWAVAIIASTVRIVAAPALG